MTDNTQQPEQPQQPQYAAPQYAQPQYAQPGPPAGPRPGTEKNWMNITSLALSLGGLVTGITVIPGIIFGHLGLSAAKRGEADNRSLGLAGVITGYVILALGLLALVAVLVFFGAFFGEIVQECTGDNPADWCTDGSTNNAWTAVTGIPA